MSSAHTTNAELKQQVFARHSKRLKRAKYAPKATTIAAYSGVFLLIMSMVAIGYQPPQRVSDVANATASPQSPVTAPVVSTEDTSVDQLVATNIAADIAERAELPIASNVANLSVSLAAESQLAQNDSDIINKPQIVQPTAGNRQIERYTTKVGDTVSLIASKFGISADTIKWANNLTSDAVEPNRNLVIPPVNGVVYSVRSGDTVDGIARKYSADRDRIIAFNDLELSGLSRGKTIIIPNGIPPVTERPGYSSVNYGGVSGFSTGGYSYSPINSQLASASAGNRYAFGNCTWYAYERRAQLGRPVGSFWGNAATWAMYARAAGYVVNNIPKAGAVMQNGGGYGHVAIVESVNSDGSITISEMNYAGNLNRVTSRTVSAGTAAGFTYIH